MPENQNFKQAGWTQTLRSCDYQERDPKLFLNHPLSKGRMVYTV